MKKNHDESIIALAFGELGQAEAAALKAELANSNEAADMLADYRAIKEDLRRLDVPPHQLSTERLRDAILGQGLKPKAVFPWKLAWMPVAAAAIAVFASQFLHSTKDPGSLAITTKPATANSLDPSLRFDPVGDLVLESLPDLRDEQPAVISASANAETGGRLRTLGSNRRGATRSNLHAAGLDATSKTMRSVNSDVNSFESAAPSAKEVESTEGAAFVLIEKERDSNTGASRAIEVSDPSNVVIGG